MAVQERPRGALMLEWKIEIINDLESGNSTKIVLATKYDVQPVEYGGANKDTPVRAKTSKRKIVFH